MKALTLVILLLVSSVFNGFGQEDVDVTKSLADPQTFLFDDGRHTVNGYIYSSLEKSAKCCGNDAIYLDVKIDPTGYVVDVKPLTGKNDCYKKSVIDIVKNIKWKSETFKTARSIYFEVKPVIPCSGSTEENVYTPISITNNPILASANTTPATDEVNRDAIEKARLEAEQKAKLEAEEKARKEAEERARLEAL